MVALDSETLGIIITVAVVAFGSGAYLTKLQINRSQPVQHKQQRVDILIDQIKSNIQWTKEMQEDVKDKLLQNPPEKERDIYQGLIKELDVKLITLERALNNISEK